MTMMKKNIVAGSRSIEANFVDDDVIFFELSEDLILEIFSHLPPISLLRFKSVSKIWYSLISNSDFLRRNTANQFDRRRWIRINYDLPPPPPNILLKRYQLAGDSRILIFPPPPPNPNDINIDQPNKKLSPLLLQNLIDYSPEHDDDNDNGGEKGKFKLLDSCNGLLLYSDDGFRKYYPISPRGGKQQQQQYRWYVCNPITQDYIKLPTLFEQEETKQGFRILDHSSPNIVFDPLVSLTYKVLTWLICIHKQEKGHYQLYVYSSETRSWRLSVSTKQLLVPHPLTSVWRGVLCSGVLYWTTKYPFFHTKVTLRYDVEKDVISTLNFPEMPLEYYSYRVLRYFGECGGRLRLIETYYKEPHMQWKHCKEINVFPSIFDVMELDNNDDLWTVKYRVNIRGDYQEGYYYADLFKKHRSPLFCIHILDLYKSKTKKEEEEEEVMLLSIGNICIIPFNLSSNTFGKELRHGEKKSVGEQDLDFMEVVRYNTITLFPPSSSL